jgi:hypothetical protein
MRWVHRRHGLDTKLALLASLAEGWELLGPQAQEEIARQVELVRFPAGASLGSAGVAGRWCTAVVKGVVATTHPAAVHRAGTCVEHGPDTSVVALEDGLALTWPVRLMGPADEPLQLYPLSTAS